MSRSAPPRSACSCGRACWNAWSPPRMCECSCKGVWHGGGKKCGCEGPGGQQERDAKAALAAAKARGDRAGVDLAERWVEHLHYANDLTSATHDAHKLRDQHRRLERDQDSYDDARAREAERVAREASRAAKREADEADREERAAREAAAQHHTQVLDAEREANEARATAVFATVVADAMARGTSAASAHQRARSDRRVPADAPYVQYATAGDARAAADEARQVERAATRRAEQHRADASTAVATAETAKARARERRETAKRVVGDHAAAVKAMKRDRGKRRVGAGQRLADPTPSTTASRGKAASMACNRVRHASGGGQAFVAVLVLLLVSVVIRGGIAAYSYLTSWVETIIDSTVSFLQLAGIAAGVTVGALAVAGGVVLGWAYWQTHGGPARLLDALDRVLAFARDHRPTVQRPQWTIPQPPRRQLEPREIVVDLVLEGTDEARELEAGGKVDPLVDELTRQRSVVREVSR